MTASLSASLHSLMSWRMDSSEGCSGFCSSLILRHSCTTSSGARHRKRYGARKDGRRMRRNSAFHVPKARSSFSSSDGEGWEEKRSSGKKRETTLLMCK